MFGLSICIPTYNYDIFKLVKDLHHQCAASSLDFEILVMDDCSTIKKVNNFKIDQFSNTTYHILNKNIGRSAIRNTLARSAKYDWLLFLDADIALKKVDFIGEYEAYLTPKPQIVYGGITYCENKPDPNKVLRWQYGKKREALEVNDRNKNKYLRFLTLNFLIHKEIFDCVCFNEDIPNSRHEDTLFSLDLEKKGIPLTHIDNPVVHLGLDTNKIFLEKSLESTKALSLLIDRRLVDPKKVFISRVYLLVCDLKMNFLLAWCYKKLKSIIEKQILSKKPNLLLFDLYRLGYYCTIHKKK